MASENKTGDSGSPCWVPSQDLITEFRKEGNLADCTPSVSLCELQGVFQNFSLA